MKNFLSYLKPHRFLLIISFLFCFISVAFSLIIPIFIGKAIDEMIGPNQVDFANIYPILLWILIFLTLSAVFSSPVRYSQVPIPFTHLKREQ